MDRVNFSFTTDSDALAESVRMVLGYGIKSITNQNGYWYFSGYANVVHYDDHIDFIKGLYKAYPNANAQLNSSYDGMDITYINQNGRMEVTWEDPNFVSYEQLDGCDMNVTMATDSNEVFRAVRKVLESEKLDWTIHTNTMCFSSSRCGQLIECLKELNVCHNTGIRMEGSINPHKWSACIFENGQILK